MRTILAFTLTLLTGMLFAQKIAFTPYAGLEGEIVKTAEPLTIGDQTVTGYASEAINWTLGLRGSYLLNERLTISLDVNKRTQYKYGYLITYPEPNLATRTTKGMHIVGYDWLLAVVGSHRILSRGGIEWNGSVGTGASKFYRPRPIVEMLPVDFGPGYEATTELWHALEEVVPRTAWVGLLGTEVAYRNFSLQLRYVKSLTRSITAPFTFRGDAYPNRNQRDSVQLLVGYRFVLK